MSGNRRNIIGVLTAAFAVCVAVVFITGQTRHESLPPPISQSVSPPALVTNESTSEPLTLAPAPPSVARVAATSAVMSPSADVPDPGEVFGRVTDEDGLPLAGVSLRLEPRFGRALDTVTDSNGAYDFAGLRLENVTVRTKSDSSTPFKNSVELSPAEPRARVDAVLIKTCKLGILLRSPRGKALPDDTDPDARLVRELSVVVAKARVDIGSEVKAVQHVGGPLIDLDGTTLDPSVWGWIGTSGRRNLFVCLELGPWVLDSQPVPSVGDTITLVADFDAIRSKLGHIVATVVDDVTGARIEGARLQYSLRSGREDDSNDLATSDSSGRIQSCDLLPGSLDPALYCRGYLRSSLKVVVASGIDTDLGVIRLSRGIEIRGRVEFEDGRTPRVVLRCTSGDPTRNSVVVGDDKTVRCKQDGSFHFTELHPGTYVITRAPLVDIMGSDITSPVTADSALNVDASRGSVSGLVLRIPRSAASSR